MTDPTRSETSSAQAQATALDWLLRIKAQPDDAQLRIELATWLASNAEHMSAWRKAEKVWRLTGQALTAPAQPETAPWRRRLLASAAVLLVTAMLTSLLAPRNTADYQTVAGESRQVELADGSLIHLDSKTSLDIDLQADQRQFTLHSGQAFFQVSHDAQRPFRVIANDAVIQVTGTAFEVRHTSGDIQVAVQEGAVQVSAPFLATQQPVALQPGERLHYDRESGQLDIDQRPTSQMATWRQGTLLVESARLADVVDELRRHYKGMIILRSERLAGQMLTGAYNLRNPESALRAAVAPYGGRVTRISPYLLVLSDTATPADK